MAILQKYDLITNWRKVEQKRCFFCQSQAVTETYQVMLEAQIN